MQFFKQTLLLICLMIGFSPEANAADEPSVSIPHPPLTRVAHVRSVYTPHLPLTLLVHQPVAITYTVIDDDYDCVFRSTRVVFSSTVHHVQATIAQCLDELMCPQATESVLDVSFANCRWVTDSTLAQFLSRVGARVETLDLSCCAHIRNLNELRCCTRLKNLNLRGYVGVPSFGVLQHFPELFILNVESTYINDTELSIIARYLSGLKELDLGGCNLVTDEGLRALIISNPGLVHLGLGGTSITNHAVKIIAITCEGLKALSLCGCRGITDITGLETCSELRELNIHTTGITNYRVIPIIQNRLKDIEIHYVVPLKR